MTNNAIIPAKTAIMTFRESGYKNTANAVAELIDNAIEANANYIRVLTFEGEVKGPKRVLRQIEEIAIYDDGDGMSEEVLAICLQFGNGTRLNSRDGIGRFGIGLPNASVSQAKRVDVYSWRDNECKHTYLDVDEIANSDQDVVNGVSNCEMPTKYLNEIDVEIKSSGTLIVWSNCDKLDLKRSKTLYSDMNQSLCRIYRHFLDDDENYGRLINIKLIAVGKDKIEYDLRPNDPLYMMRPNNCPSKENDKTNILLDDVIKIDVPLDDEKISTVEIRFSIALPETQNIGGSGGPGSLGYHYGKNVGISFVRSCREIDFGCFNYFNMQEQRERWWGCEIRFKADLDELFGVTNNKQAVRGINFFDYKEFKEEHPEDYEAFIENDNRLWLRKELSRIFKTNHKKLMDTIRTRREGTRSKDQGSPVDVSVKAANDILKEDTAETKSKVEGEKKSHEQIEEEWVDKVKETYEGDIDDDTAKEIAKVKVNSLIEKEFGSWPGSQFFTVETVGATCVLVINKKHPFYNDLYEKLEGLSETHPIETLDLTLMAFAQMQNELYSRIDDIDEITDKWGGHLKKFLQKLKEND